MTLYRNAKYVRNGNSPQQYNQLLYTNNQQKIYKTYDQHSIEKNNVTFLQNKQMLKPDNNVVYKKEDNNS